MILASILVFISGALVGSFLNVVILRYNTGRKIVNDRSECFTCGKKLKWYELIPVISFIAQGGRCRKCKSKISLQYPVVELLAGFIFWMIFSLHFTTLDLSSFSAVSNVYLAINTLYYFVLFSLFIVIAVYDFRHQIIPDAFVYPFVLLAFFIPLFENLSIGNLKLIENWSASWRMIIENLGYGLLAGIAPFLFFAALWYFSKGRAMGFGDAKLALGIGWMLGLVDGAIAIVLSFWLGALAGIFLMIWKGKKYTMQSKIAFGPFMILATAIVFFWGNIIIKLWL